MILRDDEADSATSDTRGDLLLHAEIAATLADANATLKLIQAGSGAEIENVPANALAVICPLPAYVAMVTKSWEPRGMSCQRLRAGPC